MIKRDEVAVPTSCLNRARDDEMVFLLRANDPLFAMTVSFWAHMAEATGAHTPEVVAQARDCARTGMAQRTMLWTKEKFNRWLKLTEKL